MKRKRFNEAQIIGVLQEAEAGARNGVFAGNMGLPSRPFAASLQLILFMSRF